MKAPCTVCGRPFYARGLCHTCYQREWCSGRLVPLPTRTWAQKFWSRVDKDGPTPTYRPELGGCWLWCGAIVRGYGSIKYRNYHLAHRWAYEQAMGPVPRGLVLDHLCRVRRCVNPAHLEPVTIGENCLRGAAPAIAIHHSGRCAKGHLMDAANTYVTERTDGRQCRTCHRERERARRVRIRETLGAREDVA